MKSKYLLLFSAQACASYGSNIIKATDGTLVEYTSLTENHENWQENYKWQDAKEVGFAESVNDIVEFGIKVSRYGWE